MTPETTRELETLADGVRSPFWALFDTFRRQEWGLGGLRYAEAVRRAAEKGDADALAYLRMVIFAQQEIERLFRWPHERLRQLLERQRHAAQPDTGSRRGPGL